MFLAAGYMGSQHELLIIRLNCNENDILCVWWYDMTATECLPHIWRYISVLVQLFKFSRRRFSLNQTHIHAFVILPI
jgi:hypothetical protein